MYYWGQLEYISSIIGFNTATYVFGFDCPIDRPLDRPIQNLRNKKYKKGEKKDGKTWYFRGVKSKSIQVNPTKIQVNPSNCTFQLVSPKNKKRPQTQSYQMLKANSHRHQCCMICFHPHNYL